MTAHSCRMPTHTYNLQFCCSYILNTPICSVAPGAAPFFLSERAMAALQSRKTPPATYNLDMNLIGDYWGWFGKRSYHHTGGLAVRGWGARAGAGPGWELHRDGASVGECAIFALPSLRHQASAPYPRRNVFETQCDIPFTAAASIKYLPPLCPISPHAQPPCPRSTPCARRWRWCRRRAWRPCGSATRTCTTRERGAAAYARPGGLGKTLLQCLCVR